MDDRPFFLCKICRLRIIEEHDEGTLICVCKNCLWITGSVLDPYHADELVAALKLAEHGFSIKLCEMVPRLINELLTLRSEVAKLRRVQ